LNSHIPVGEQHDSIPTKRESVLKVNSGLISYLLLLIKQIVYFSSVHIILSISCI